MMRYIWFMETIDRITNTKSITPTEEKIFNDYLLSPLTVSTRLKAFRTFWEVAFRLEYDTESELYREVPILSSVVSIDGSILHHTKFSNERYRNLIKTPSGRVVMVEEEAARRRQDDRRHKESSYAFCGLKHWTPEAVNLENVLPNEKEFYDFIARDELENRDKLHHDHSLGDSVKNARSIFDGDIYKEWGCSQQTHYNLRTFFPSPSYVPVKSGDTNKMIKNPEGKLILVRDHLMTFPGFDKMYRSVFDVPKKGISKNKIKIKMSDVLKAQNIMFLFPLLISFILIFTLAGR